jgi:hypothetical protein
VIDAIHEWADLASILGLFASLIGFCITIVGVFKLKNAAVAASQAVSEVRKKLTAQTAVFDLNRIMADVEELKPLHRLGVWEVLPARYAAVRKQLLALKLTYPGLSKAQKSSIQGVIQQFATIEGIVENALAGGTLPADVPVLNKIAAEQGDKLNAILITVQTTIGG